MCVVFSLSVILTCYDAVDSAGYNDDNYSVTPSSLASVYCVCRLH